MKKPRPHILALDPATSTGIAIGQAGGDPLLETRRWRVRADEPVADVLGRAVYWLNGVLSTVEVVAVETPPYIVGDSNRAVDEFLQRLYGAICGVVRSRQILLVEVAPNAWRRTFLGAGNGSLARAPAKAAAMRQCQLLGWKPVDDNSADAGGVWFHAAAQVAPWSNPQVGPLFLAAGVR